MQQDIMQWVMSHIWMSHVTHMNESCHTWGHATGHHAIHHSVQDGEDPYDAWSCRSFSAKEPLIIGLFCGKWPVKIRHPMGLRHPVYVCKARSGSYIAHWVHVSSCLPLYEGKAFSMSSNRNLDLQENICSINTCARKHPLTFGEYTFTSQYINIYIYLCTSIPALKNI